MEQWVWALLGLALGSLPFSVWVGQLGLKTDIRTVGDGNPGAFNVMRAGGFMWGGLAIALDIGKAALPIGLAAYVFNVTGAPLVAAAIAPALGHAFSPWLGFKGGKAIAPSGGMWVGLTIWSVTLVGSLGLIVWFVMLTSSGWAVMFTMSTILVYLGLSGAPAEWFAAWGLSLLLLEYKHRAELRQPPRLRPPSGKRR
ncbi:MAG: glycerol-3-phosphate acyltransferase [Armatimonadetes bacterium]|nr:glycerol-3-phosphate acyltransferase [Anaerolineae bacterium]